MRPDRVVEVAEVVDHAGHLGAVGGQLAPELLDLDRAVVALDDAVGLRRPAPGAYVTQLGPGSDEALERGGLEARAVVGDRKDREVLAGLGTARQVLDQ